MIDPVTLSRRSLLAAGAAIGLAPAIASARAGRGHRFPAGFLWGAATAPHQIEGNNIASDLWFLENQQPTVFADPSGDACNSLELWPVDLDIARSLNFNTYRFGVEWARIEPEHGLFSQAMIDHYRAMIAGCHERGLKPIVTFNHFTAPRWFSARGGWANPDAPALFARYCDRLARAIGSDIAMAITFNEPNLMRILERVVPPQGWESQGMALKHAAERLGVEKFLCANVMALSDIPLVEAGQAAAHQEARKAIKAAAPALPVGMTLAVNDDQAAGPGSMRDAMREQAYGIWTSLAREDDFVGVQNYHRTVWGAEGALPSPEGADRNWSGSEVWAPSLAGAVRYVHEATGKPILVSEHGVGTDDDALRSRFIPEALCHLAQAMNDGVPVLGYLHWSLLDNFEWIFGYKPAFGLVSVDRETFARKPKHSAAVLAEIAKANGI